MEVKHYKPKRKRLTVFRAVRMSQAHLSMLKDIQRRFGLRNPCDAVRFCVIHTFEERSERLLAQR